MILLLENTLGATWATVEGSGREGEQSFDLSHI